MCLLCPLHCDTSTAQNEVAETYSTVWQLQLPLRLVIMTNHHVSSATRCGKARQRTNWSLSRLSFLLPHYTPSAIVSSHARADAAAAAAAGGVWLDKNVFQVTFMKCAECVFSVLGASRVGIVPLHTLS